MDGLTDWLMDWLIDGLIDGLIDWLGKNGFLFVLLLKKKWLTAHFKHRAVVSEGIGYGHG